MSQVTLNQWIRITALAVLCQICNTVAAQQCEGESVYSIYGMMLIRHTFHKMKTNNAFECRRACKAEVRCQSFNYVMSKDECELNNRTKEARPMDFISNEERYYMKRDTKRVSLGSISELPAQSCKEIKSSEGASVSGKYWLDSIVPGNAVLVHCDMESEAIVIECTDYHSLATADRKATFTGQDPVLCDDKLGPGWFRFQGDAGTRMPTSCTLAHRCGTHATGWLNGTHPTVAEGKVTRQVCFKYVSCCDLSINIKVRNCGGYYVYYFSSTPAQSDQSPPGHCSLRYCGTD